MVIGGKYPSVQAIQPGVTNSRLCYVHFSIFCVLFWNHLL